MQNNNWTNGWQIIKLWFLHTCKFNLSNTGRGFALYANYEECCVHCGTTRRLRKSKEVYPICVTHVLVQERKVVAKKRAPVSKNPKKWNLQLTEVYNIPSFIFKNMSWSKVSSSCCVCFSSLLLSLFYLFPYFYWNQIFVRQGFNYILC